MRRQYVLFCCFCLLLAPLIWIYAFHGLYGINVVLRRGGSIWPEVARDDSRLSGAVRLALAGATGTPGEIIWSVQRPGFEVAELPVLFQGKAVDHVLLARIDPTLWTLSVHSAPAGDHDIDRWMRQLNAALVVNGSYFDAKGHPDTPFISNGVTLGPVEYLASHGAFVASSAGARVIDLKGRNWHDVVGGATNAMVSYPMLIGDDGQSRAKPSKWLAGRSFIGQDRANRIVIGTTVDAFMTLDQFALLLRDSSLDLATALNLDGGTLACQSIAVGDYRRRTCGAQELQVDGDNIKLLQSIIPSEWALPIVLAVTAK
ncbi:MAG: hypothetical protein JWL62_14 [Hyphomicrobiales bacterium]|nr:hypothetical protein [Hyphomicrobiales bacterium]